MTSPTGSNRTQSQKLQQRAERFFPGGVNSPVRAFRAVGGNPPFVESGEGAYLTDADGNRYIDYFGASASEDPFDPASRGETGGR